ncbi:MAG: DNA alkylation repair protein [Rikenellaceae bacterium]
MSEYSSRLAYLLGEMQRQMNGGVVGSMRFYGDDYGLNYGVTLTTIRAIAKGEREQQGGANHRLAKLLYRQEVRELRLAGLWLADSTDADSDLEFWGRGIINSDVAEEAAFALLHRCEGVDRWLDSDSELLQYCALMAIAKRGEIVLAKYCHSIVKLINDATHITQNGVVALLDSAIKCGVESDEITTLLSKLSECKAAEYVRSEMAWRLEYR